NRDLRPELVQSRRRGICDGFLYAGRAQAIPFALSRDGEIHHRGWHHPDQALARGRDGRAGAPLQGENRRSAAAMETEPDGYGILPSMERLFGGAGPYAEGDQHETIAMV